MREKPQKRLVSKRHYLRVLGKRVTYLSIFTVALILGSLFSALPLQTHDTHTGAVILCAAYALGMFSLAFCFVRAERRLEKVKLITLHNQHLLPPEESLVRASDAPPTHQQAELLRAAPQGCETPAEELLRAGTNRQGN